MKFIAKQKFSIQKPSLLSVLFAGHTSVCALALLTLNWHSYTQKKSTFKTYHKVIICDKGGIFFSRCRKQCRILLIDLPEHAHYWEMKGFRHSRSNPGENSELPHADRLCSHEFSTWKTVSDFHRSSEVLCIFLSYNCENKIKTQTKLFLYNTFYFLFFYFRNTLQE